MNHKQLENIRQMEAILNKTAEFNCEAEQFLEKWQALLPEIQKLDQYYGSEQWWQDHEADNNGEIPPEEPRGILGEDLAYDALGGQHHLAIAFLKLATKIIARDEA